MLLEDSTIGEDSTAPEDLTFIQIVRMGMRVFIQILPDDTPVNVTKTKQMMRVFVRIVPDNAPVNVTKTKQM